MAWITTVAARAPPGSVGSLVGGWTWTDTCAGLRDSWIVDPAHWDGLPDGHTRAVTLDPAPNPDRPAHPRSEPEPLAALLRRRHADVIVAARPLTDYTHAAQETPR